MKYVRPNMVWSQILNAAVRRCDGQTDTIKWSGPCNLKYFVTKFEIKSMSISKHTDVRYKRFLNLLRRKKNISEMVITVRRVELYVISCPFSSDEYSGLAIPK